MRISDAMLAELEALFEKATPGEWRKPFDDAWYLDPVRVLPRKVVADFSELLDLAEEALRCRGALETIAKSGHRDTCSCSLGDYPCDCHVSIARATLAK